MAYLNPRGLDELWDRISSIFGRKTQAAGSQNLNGTTIVLLAIDGNELSSIDLGATFVTKDELDAAISEGTTGLLTRSAADGLYARSQTYVEGTKALTLRDGNGNALSTVYIN